MKPINKEFFDAYFTGKKRSKNYAKAVDVYHHISFHFDGYYKKPWITGSVPPDQFAVNPYFQRIIDSRRPSESPYILAYRRLQYLPITASPCHAVVNSLKKIVKSSDWHIDYSEAEVPPFLPEADTLERYCEKLYPASDSIENWAYTTLMRWLLVDPNGIICVMPLSWEIEPNEYIKPYAHIIQSRDVYDFKEGKYCVFLSPYESEFMDKDGNHHHGKIIMCVTRDSYFEARQINTEKDFEVFEYPHNMGEMPAFYLGGEPKTPDMSQPYYESFIHSMLPSLDSAARDSSDLDAEKVQNLYSQQWVMQMQSCTACQGIGQIISGGSQTVCPSCKGLGGVSPSPYNVWEVNLNNPLGEQKNIPIPPGGYVKKDTIEMVAAISNEIDKAIYRALASLNMQFLDKQPMNESGLAKSVDRDELNSFVYSIAYHLIENLINPIYYFINELRYSSIVPDRETRQKMLPKIPVPQVFDFLTDKDAEDNLIKISASNVSNEIKELAEMDFIHSKYQQEPNVRERLIAIHDHNPLKNYSITDINSMLTAGLVSKEDAVLSVFISDFVNELMFKDEHFTTLPFDQQREQLVEMATAKAEALSAQVAIKKKADLKEKIAILDHTPAVVPEKIDAKRTGEKQRKNERNALDQA